MKNLEPKISRAKELIHTSRHISLATANADGSPHNSPVRFFSDEKLENIYWGSNTEALHSQNILRTGKIFAVLFDRTESGGVFIKCEGGHVLDGKELEVGLEIVNSCRAKAGEQEIALEYYSAGSVQKLWSAKITNLWINMPVRDENGLILRDERVELDRNILRA
ncbi:MAG TPA: pyridoxamine 5'-phosphate oxidase family protein [Candidatus Paceibacterota bacterium]